MKEILNIVNQYAWEKGPISVEGARRVPNEVRQALAEAFADMAGQIMALKKKLGMAEYAAFGTDNFTERLAQAYKERDLASAREHDMSLRLAQAERERDEAIKEREWYRNNWEAQAQRLEESEKVIPDDYLNRDIDPGHPVAKHRAAWMRGENPSFNGLNELAALAERLAQTARERDECKDELTAALAKAEAAWKCDEALAREDDLRARIEALANGWYSDPALQQQLRALLTPPKAETPLDVVDWLEKHGGAKGPREQPYYDALAKLRNLLELAT